MNGVLHTTLHSQDTYMKLHKTDDLHFSLSLQTFDHRFQWVSEFKWADINSMHVNYIFNVNENMFKYNGLRMYYEVK